MRSDAASRACGLWELAHTVFYFPERLERAQKELRLVVGASGSKSLARSCTELQVPQARSGAAAAVNRRVKRACVPSEDSRGNFEQLSEPCDECSPP